MIVQLHLDTQNDADVIVLQALGKIMNAEPVDFEDVTPDIVVADSSRAEPKPKATKPKATKPKATKPKATKPKATKPKATKAETETVEFADLRAAFMQYVQKNDTDAGLQALKDVGATRLSQVTPDKFAELMAEVSK